MSHEEGNCETAEALIERLDGALCTLLHRGDELGEHSPESHLDLFYSRQQETQPGRDIGWAVNNMRSGLRVRRRGWNGKGMYLAFQRGYPDGIPINANTAQATGLPEGTVCKFLPYVMMRTATGEFVPWLCSQTDLLAYDWEVAE